MSDTSFIENWNFGKTHDINELTELKLDSHRECVADVENGAHELVVVAQQVVVQPLRVWIASATCGAIKSR